MSSKLGAIQRAYRSDLIQYQTWCLENGLAAIPATADTMSMYVDYLSANNKSATIRRRINSLGTVLKLSKNYDPTKQPEVVLALKRMHRKIGRAQDQATPLTKKLLNQLLASCDNSVMGIRNKVLLSLGYETMRRRSELCAFKFEDICQGRLTENRLSGLTSQRRINSGLERYYPSAKNCSTY